MEGKKTMGYEFAEDLGRTLPDAVLYSTGGTALIGMWNAFEEMEEMGWIGPKRPKMFAIQAEGCAPIPKAFAEGRETAEKFPNARTYASGLRVPKPFADYLILRYVRESGGAAIAVTDDEMRRACDEMGAAEGLFAAPEGGAVWAEAKLLRGAGRLDPASWVVLFNNGTGSSTSEACRAVAPFSRFALPDNDMRGQIAVFLMKTFGLQEETPFGGGKGSRAPGERV